MNENLNITTSKNNYFYWISIYTNTASIPANWKVTQLSLLEYKNINNGFTLNDNSIICEYEGVIRISSFLKCGSASERNQIGLVPRITNCNGESYKQFGAINNGLTANSAPSTSFNQDLYVEQNAVITFSGTSNFVTNINDFLATISYLYLV